MFLEWQLKKQRLKHQKKLNDNNLCLYKSITFYINNSNLSKIEKEEILHQILDMMIEVQINNKNMDIIVGDNYEEFCETIISEYKYGKSKVYNILIYLQQYLIWFLITSLIIFSTNILTNNGNIGITINEIIIASAIALFIIPVVKKNKQKTSYIVDIRHKIATMNFNYTTVEIYALVCEQIS